MQLHLCLASKASCVKNRRKDKVSSNTERPRMPIEELLTISIGMGSNQSGLFESVRGKSVPLRISKVVSSKKILEEAVKKRASYDRYRLYQLCYPDATVVVNLPGNKESFTPGGVF